MKKTLIILACVITVNVTAQNWFPTAIGTKAGIGTITPDARLQIIADWPTNSIGWNPANIVKSGLLIGTSTRGLAFDANEIVTIGDNLYFGTMSPDTDVIIRAGSAATRMFIDGSNGDVGIGTTNTFGHKLAVKGGIIAGEIKIEDVTLWPDYVFEEEYNLLSLEEVEQHIEEKGHLPNIPSAKEVEEKGSFSLGEMNKKLLEKVEELMLYTIQQEKRIKALEEKLENKKG